VEVGQQHYELTDAPVDTHEVEKCTHRAVGQYHHDKFVRDDGERTQASDYVCGYLRAREVLAEDQRPTGCEKVIG
jgi:hypothetical protein